MIELSLEEWAERIFSSKRYSVRRIDYESGFTIVYDNNTDMFYIAEYDKEANKIQLRESLNASA